MRPDQIKRFDELEEKLADVVLEEADPDTWPGSGTPLADMDKDTRGDRYWSKKNAAASMALLTKTQTIRENTKGAIGRDPRDDAELDREIARAEREAEALLAQVQKSSKSRKHAA